MSDTSTGVQPKAEWFLVGTKAKEVAAVTHKI